MWEVDTRKAVLANFEGDLIDLSNYCFEKQLLA